MQRITWNGVALHGGPLPGYAASHGCVRMPFGYAEKEFDKTRDRDAGDHLADRRCSGRVFRPEALFVPKRECPRGRSDAVPRRVSREIAEAAQAADETKKAAAVCDTRDSPGDHRVAAQAAISRRPAPPTPTSPTPTRRLLANAKTDQAKAKAADLQAKGRTAKAAELTTQLDTAKADSKSKLDDAAAALKDAAKAAATKKADTRQDGHRRQARGRAGLGLHQPRHAEALRPARYPQALRPTTAARCSISASKFQSRSAIPTSRSAPISSRRWRGNDSGGLRWSAVTIDNGDDAKDALDRITIPQEVLDRIAPDRFALDPRSSSPTNR